jgi:hypothetical protein
MYRKILIYINIMCFLLAQNAFAVSNPNTTQTSQVRDFIQKTEITKNAFTLSQFSYRISDSIPNDRRAAILGMLGQFGQHKIDKVDVKKVQAKGQEQIEMTFYQGKNYSTVILENHPQKFATIKIYESGKERSVEITPQDMEGDPKLLAMKLAGYKPGIELKLLSKDGIQRLPANEQIQYFKNLQEIVVTAEKLQNKAYKTNSESNKKTSWLNLLIDEAQAQLNGLEGKACICAGYPTNYGSVGCCDNIRNRIVKTQGGRNQITCNPEIFGNIPLIIDFMGPKIPIDVTEQCAQKADSEPEKYRSPRNFGISGTTKEQWEKSNREIISKITNISDNICNRVELVGFENVLSDQRPTCQAMRNAVKKINFSCDYLVQRGLSQNTVCHVSTPASQAPIQPPRPLTAAGANQRPAASSGGGGGGAQDGDGQRPSGPVASRPADSAGNNHNLPPLPPAIPVAQRPEPVAVPQDVTPAAVQPAPAVATVDNGNAAPQAPAASQVPSSLIKCGNLRELEAANTARVINCSYGSTASVECATTDNQRKSLSYCSCESALEARSGYAISCGQNSKSNASQDGSQARPGKREIEKPFYKEDWFKWGLIGLVGLASIYALYAWQKKENDKITNMYYSPTAPALAPPPNTGTNRTVPGQR